MRLGCSQTLKGRLKGMNGEMRGEVAAIILRKSVSKWTNISQKTTIREMIERVQKKETETSKM